MGRSVTAVMLAAVVGALVAAPAPAQPCQPGEHTVEDATVTSPDGTSIAITVMRPGAADCGPVPVVLHGHGWSGSRARSADANLGYISARTLLDAGYGIISIDARGHGDSGDVAHVMQPDAELTDYPAVIDWAYDHLPWVQRQRDSGLPKDIVAGGLGASYGGGWQTLTSTVDDRLDALVPIITWYDLPHALAPNDVPRTAWVTLLYAAGKAFARIDPRIDQWYVEGLATNRLPAAAREHFLRASPVSYTDRMRTPALLIQGLPDTLFPLDHALGNYQAIRSNGVDAYLLGINTGHILPGLQPTGVGAPSRSATDLCVSDIAGHILNYYGAYLRGDAAARAAFQRVPRVALSTEQGGCVSADDWPVHDREETIEVGTVVVPQGGGTVLLPLLSPDADVTVAGMPRLDATVPLGLEEIGFVSLQLVTPDGANYIVDDQVTPFRTELAEVDGRLSLELAGVATTVPAGGTLLLRVEGVNEQFAGSGNRRPGILTLTDVSVTLPVVSAAPHGPIDTTAAAPGPSAPEVQSVPAAAPASPPAAPLPTTGGGLAAVGVLLLALVAWRRR